MIEVLGPTSGKSLSMQPATTRLPSVVRAQASILVVGDVQLFGGVEQRRLGDGGLPSELAAQSALMPGRAADVDVVWNLRAALNAVVGPASMGRLDVYSGIVVAIEAGDVVPTVRRLSQLLSSRRRPEGGGPALILALASVEPDDGQAVEARALIERVLRPSGAGYRATVVAARMDPSGVLGSPSRVAADVLEVIATAAETRPPAGDEAATDPREVAVDRSLRALSGRTSHLRRAVVLAQNSFDVPYAQLNLVSRGTLRSLAFIGRSSDGLQHSLSAEAVRQDGALLIPDTRLATRWTHIPEVHGPAAIRYYAGHPVHSAGGHRIGVLCVLDTTPHDVLPGDDVLIRDLALLAEGELAALTG